MLPQSHFPQSICVQCRKIVVDHEKLFCNDCANPPAKKVTPDDPWDHRDYLILAGILAVITGFLLIAVSLFAFAALGVWHVVHG